MKLLVLLIESLFIIFFYSYIFDNGFLGIVIIIFSNLLIFKNYQLDKNYNQFISLINENEFNNLDEAINEFKKNKKYFFRLFNKRNSDVLTKINDIKMSKNDVNRFIEIQNKKNLFIINSFNKRIKIFIFYIIFLVCSFFPLLFNRIFKLDYYYNLYNNYIFIYLFSLFYILIHNYILYKLSDYNKKEISLFDNYSLCFHQNILQILELDETRLTFDKKGIVNEITLSECENLKFNYLIFIPLIFSLILSILL